MTRSVAVLRMHLIDSRTLILTPLSVLALASGVVAAVFASVAPDGRVTGAAMSIYCVVLSGGILNVLRGLPFTLGMGVSRRAFALGTAALAGLMAVCFGTLVMVLGLIERDTGGWGGQAHMYYWAWVDSSGPVAWWLLVSVPFVATFAIGAAAAAVQLRFGPPGLFGALIATLLIGGGFGVVVTWLRDWTALGQWLVGLDPWEVSGLFAAAVVLFGAIAWRALSRTTL